MPERLLTPRQEGRLPFGVGGEYGYPAIEFGTAVDAAAAGDEDLLAILDTLGNASAAQDRYGLANGESSERRAARVARNEARGWPFPSSPYWASAFLRLPGGAMLPQGNGHPEERVSP